MDAFIINGENRLKGKVRIGGAKNACLPLMAAALLTEQPLTLHDVPNLSDINNMIRLLNELGCETNRDSQKQHTVNLHVTSEEKSKAPYEIVSTMRASICVLGPMLAKRGIAQVSLPGGCNIGDRPIDLHLRGLKALGAEIILDGGYVTARAEKLKGANIFLGGPNGTTVLGTANVLSAATLAEGTTLIEHAACEPEIVDLANMLNAMGADIQGAGTPRIVINGVEELNGTEHTVIADRIVAGTYMIAAAITNGDLTIENCPLDALMAFLDQLNNIGVEVSLTKDSPNDVLRSTVTVSSARRLEPIVVATQPHPGYPTDLQAQLMALLTLADGNSIITEKVFTERFMHVAELSRMGAQMYRQGPTVMVSGVKQLIGAPVMASDLRASAGLVLAGLAAKGQTTLQRVYHLDRGYEAMEVTLRELGADIERVKL